MSNWPVKKRAAISTRHTTRQKHGRNRSSAGAISGIDWQPTIQDVGAAFGRRNSPHLGAKNWDVWYKDNMNIITQLSSLMSEPIYEMGQLLYGLTLQNYNNILNPKSSGWNSKRVPFVRMDACDHYLHIFTLDGNLRDPRHPRSLVLLLEYIKSILNSEPEQSSKNSLTSILRSDISTGTAAAYAATSSDPALSYASTYHELYPYFEKKIYYMYHRRLRRLLDLDTDQPTIAHEIQLQNRRMLEQGKRAWTVATTKSRRQTLHHRYSQKQPRGMSFTSGPRALYSLGSTSHNGGLRSPIDGRESSIRFSDQLLFDDKGRRRGHGSRQLNDLRSKRAEIMRLLIAKMHKGDTERLLKSLKTVDLKEPSRTKRAKKAKVAAKELDDFYSETVRTHGKDERNEAPTKLPEFLHRLSNVKSQDLINRQKQILPEQESKQTIGEKERRFYGDPLPVLFHAPYNESLESTWMRRHPDQLRLQEDGHLRAVGTPRYKRQSIEESLNVARRRYSIHSLNSPSQSEAVLTGKVSALKKKPEYRRVFSSMSGRRLNKTRR